MATNKEKIIIGNPSYLIFFDDINVTHLVKSFNVELNCDGQIGAASVEMIYAPDLFEQRSKLATRHIVEYEDGIVHMVNMKVFIKNMFTNKYILVFDGDIKSKSLSRSHGSASITFMANDYLVWLNKTIVPLAIPLDESLNAGDLLRWKAQGINPESKEIRRISNNNQNTFRGESLKETITKLQNQTLITNKLYSDPNTASMWDNAVGRIKIMGDIDPKLRDKRVIDFVINSSSTSVSSLYVLINDLIKNLLFEFYQDRDGYIRIKPPYWNEKVLKDHIIDPSMIMSYTESRNWHSYFTRVVVTGGIEEYEEQYTQESKKLVTPVVAYALGSTSAGGSIITDFLSSGKLVDRGASATKYDFDEYTVQTGDTLAKIAKKFDITDTRIAIDNNLSYPSYVTPGQKLKIRKTEKNTDPTTEFVANTGNDTFLYPTDLERRFGVNVYDAQQPLIKFSNANSINPGSRDAVDALKTYAQFMINILNSAFTMSSMQTIAMPWIRPGFNVWVDPLTVDKVFYVGGISHQGSAEGGVYTTMRLSMGRRANWFSEFAGTFGAQREGTTVPRDNLFVNQIFSEFEPGSFGPTLNSSDDYETVRKAFATYYSMSNDDVEYTMKSEHFKALYGSDAIDKVSDTNPKIFSGEYTPDEIQKRITNNYASAPGVVKERRDYLKKVITKAETYIKTHYVVEG